MNFVCWILSLYVHIITQVKYQGSIAVELSILGYSQDRIKEIWFWLSCRTANGIWRARPQSAGREYPQKYNVWVLKPCPSHMWWRASLVAPTSSWKNFLKGLEQQHQPFSAWLFTAPSVPHQSHGWGLPCPAHILEHQTAAEGWDQVLWSTEPGAHWMWDASAQATGPNVPKSMDPLSWQLQRV